VGVHLNSGLGPRMGDNRSSQFSGPVAYPGIFSGGGGSTNSVEDREKGDLGAVASQSGVLEAAVIWYKKFHFI